MPAGTHAHGGRESRDGRQCQGRRAALKLLTYVPPAILTFSVAAQAGSDPPDPPFGPEHPLHDEAPLYSTPKKR